MQAGLGLEILSLVSLWTIRVAVVFSCSALKVLSATT